MKVARCLLITLALVIVALPSNAEVRRLCLVAYERAYSYSDDYLTFVPKGLNS